MKTLTSILILILFIFGCPDSKAYIPVRRAELSNLCVRAIGQDYYGYIWIATANGLCKSFGYEYEIYFGELNDPQTVPSNSVLGLMTDRDGWLLVATNMGACGLEKGTKTFHRFAIDGKESSDFCAYGFVEYAGRLFCYGTGGLYEIDKSSKRMTPRVLSEGDAVTSAVKGPDGLLWISNGLYLTGIDSGLNSSLRLKFDSSTRIRTMAVSDKHLLLGTPNGMLSFNPSDHTTSPTSIGSDTEVSHILSLDDGIHLIATGNRGILVYDSKTGNVSRKYNNIDFNELQTTEINNIFSDRSKNIWVSTFDRGEVLLTDRMRLFNTDRNLINAFRNEFVTRATPDRYGNLWVGTRYNGIACFNNVSKDKRYFNSHTCAALSSFSHDFVQEMAFDSDGRLWAGYNNGLLVCRPEYSGSSPTGQLTVIKRFPSFVNVVSISEDNNGHMWVGTDNCGLFIFDWELNIIKTISTPLIRSNNITKILPYDEKHILISAYTDNLYLVDIERMTVRNFEPSNQKVWSSAIDMMLDRDNNLWIGTYHNGLLRLDAKTREITSCLGNQTYDIVGLSQDSNGDIWASSSYGIYRFDSSGKKINSYLKPDGLGGNQFHEKCVASMPGGKILFGGNAGLEEIDPNTDAKFTPPQYTVDYQRIMVFTRLPARIERRYGQSCGSLC